MTDNPIEATHDMTPRNDVGTLLARLGGADPEVLAQTSGERGRFIQMGLVLVSAAGLAAFSMAFALTDGLRLPVPAAAMLGLIWGTIILNIDRLLILTMKPTQGFLRLLLVILPRLAMATLLALVIATPLTLRIFYSEIEARMILDNAMAAEQQGEARNRDPRYDELEAIRADIARYEEVRGGQVTHVSLALEQAQEEYDTAAADLAEKQSAYNAKNLEWRCERFGERCEGGSGVFGNGPRAQVLEQELNQLAGEVAAAQNTTDTKRAALLAAQEQNAADLAERLVADRAEADSVLPQLRDRRDELEGELGALTDRDASTLEQSTGLLARIEALDRLGEESNSARTAHLAVAGLLFMVELLPVLVKALTLMGGKSQYDRIGELLDKRTMDSASRRHSGQRRWQQKTDQVAEEIEDDMLAREVALGKRANGHVASEMEKILDVALRDWSGQVAHALTGQGSTVPGGPRGRASVPNSPGPGPPSQPSDKSGFLLQRVRARFRHLWRGKP